MDRDALISGDVDRVRRGPRVEKNVLEAAERDEGAPVVGPEVVNPGLDDGRVQFPLRRVTVQRLAVEKTVDGVRHAPRIVGRPAGVGPAGLGVFYEISAAPGLGR